MASIKAFIFLTWIAFGLGTLVYAVLATELNRFIIFKEPIPDKALADHVIRTENVANEGSCRVKCYLEPNCVSINVGPADEEGYTCELNNATDESPMQSDLKERQHYIHYAIENVCHVHGDPCPGENNLCQVGFTDKGYRCKCRQGYEYVENDCQDIDECHLELYNCSSGMECVNEPGSFRCDCLSGYTKDGVVCIDNDECELNSSHNCPPNLQCVNEPGSFRCDCDPGFIEDGASCKDDPCQSYHVLNNADRRVQNTARNKVKCDRSLKDLNTLPGWYRFTGAAGDGMPTECVPMRRCGTNAPGWLNGSHPTVQEGIVTRKVCYHWNNNCCRRHNNIRIKNCSAYFVYELENTPKCPLRYCGNYEVDPCQSYHVLNSTDRRVQNTARNNVKYDRSSRDLSTLPGWYRFTGAAGDGMPTECVPMRRCGTNAPGWLNGSHPTVQEGIVTRKVCYHWRSNCCRWNNNIRIKNCSAYFVYELENTPHCWLRYCGNYEENWKKINDGLVCFKARDDKCGSFEIKVSGFIYTFKLVRQSGEVKCATDDPASYWGCTHSSFGDMRLSTFITFPNKTTLLPSVSKGIRTGSDCVIKDYSYKIDGVDSNANELVFNNLRSPMSVTAGQEFQIWYGEDLTNCYEDDNSGETCADVYAWYV